MAARILVVDDEDLIRWALKERLTEEEHEVDVAQNAASAEDLLKTKTFDLALLDLKLPDGDGIALMRRARALQQDISIVIITAYSTVDSAVQAMKEGAYDYVSKPFNMDELALTVARALEAHSLRQTLSAELAQKKCHFGLNSVVGNSPRFQAVKDIARKLAASDSTTVLLLGETGSGKDMIARAIHYESARAQKPFLNVTCTAMQETLIESELFGHEKGAFTDAVGRKEGLFELGHGGTVFLDEIGDMPANLQAKLLRVLEDKSFRRIGGTADIRVDCRVIAATNRDLEAAIEEGRFRDDLYYRLSTVPVWVPPLRERPGDVPLLAEHFLQTYQRRFARELRGISAEARQRLAAYAWPGNVRELRNVIERAVLLSSRDEIGAGDIVLGRGQAGAATQGAYPVTLPPEGCTLSEVEEALVAQALQRTEGNQTRAAELLGISRDQIRYKIEKFGLATHPAG